MLLIDLCVKVNIHSHIHCTLAQILNKMVLFKDINMKYPFGLIIMLHVILQFRHGSAYTN